MLAIAALFAIGPETLWPVALLQYFPPVLLAAALVALACTFRLGWGWRCLAMALCALSVFYFMGLEVHLQPTAKDRLRIMTYNVKEYLARKRVDGTLMVADEISRHNADVIVLQDAGGLADVLARSEPLRKLVVGDRKMYAFGQYLVASRIPMKDCAPGDISYRGESHTYVRCVLTYRNREFDLFGVHFATPRDGMNAVRSGWFSGVDEWRQNVSDRMTQATALAKAIRASPRPTIVAGDLNAPMPSMVIRTLQQVGLHDAFAGAGNGFGNTYGHSFSPGISFMRIDHILHSSEFEPSRCFEGGEESSAHRPVIADFDMP